MSPADLPVPIGEVIAKLLDGLHAFSSAAQTIVEDDADSYRIKCVDIVDLVETARLEGEWHERAVWSVTREFLGCGTEDIEDEVELRLHELAEMGHRICLNCYRPIPRGAS